MPDNNNPPNKDLKEINEQNMGLIHTAIPKLDKSDTSNANTIDAAKQSLDNLRDIGEIHEFNKAILNIPIDFQVNGTHIKIQGKALRPTEVIDSLMYDLMLLTLDNVSDDTPIIEKIKWAKEKNHKIFELSIEILFKIVNTDWNNPEISRAWIADNIPITDPINAGSGEGDDSLGIQIIKAYRQRCNSSNFFLELFQARALV